MTTQAATRANTESACSQDLDAHVVVLTNYLPPYERPVFEALRRRVARLTVLLSTPMEKNREWRPDWGTLDVQVQRTLTFRRGWRHSVGFTDFTELHFPLDTHSRLRALRPDVIVSRELGARSLFAAAHVRGAGRPAFVISTYMSEHSEMGRSTTRRLLRRWLIRHSDCVTANGTSGSRYLCSLGASPERVFLVPYAAAPGVLYDGPAERDETRAHRLLYVGQLTERKGVELFVRALSRWADSRRDQRVSLTIAGTGPLADRIRRLSIPANLTVDLLGHCSAEQLCRCYAEAGILVFPTLADEWGIVVNEAMSAGLPILGSIYSQAVEELCEEGVTGWLYRPDLDSEVMSALDRAFSTSIEDLNVMRSAARRRVVGSTPESSASTYVAVIKAALEARRGRSLNQRPGVPI